MEHPIKTGDARPVNQNPYPLSFSQLEEQRNQIAKPVKKGLPGPIRQEAGREVANVH